jgi:hypothetical protein
LATPAQQYSINQTLVEFEDLYGTPKNRWFNDLVFSFRVAARDLDPVLAVTSVPEPATQYLLALGLLFIRNHCRQAQLLNYQHCPRATSFH